MKVELRQAVPSQAPQYTELWVNGYMLGEYINGKDKKYLNPQKWAKEMVKKRVKVLERNIARLEKELEDAIVEHGLIQE
jgi:hypothetical protein